MPKGQKMPRPGKVRVFFGEPIWFNPSETSEEAASGYPAYLAFTKRVEKAVLEVSRLPGRVRKPVFRGGFGAVGKEKPVRSGTGSFPTPSK